MSVAVSAADGPSPPPPPLRDAPRDVFFEGFLTDEDVRFRRNDADAAEADPPVVEGAGSRAETPIFGTSLRSEASGRVLKSTLA
jgi:hypothetical protein